MRVLIPDEALRWGWQKGLTPRGPDPTVMEKAPNVIRGVVCWPYGQNRGFTNG